MLLDDGHFVGFYIVSATGKFVADRGRGEVVGVGCLLMEALLELRHRWWGEVEEAVVVGR